MKTINTKRLSIAFIGGGLNSAIGNTHKIASQMDNKFQLISGSFSRDTKTNTQTSIEYYTDTFYDSYLELLENEKENLDAIVILTPTDTHYQIILDILKYNIPIICEKTLTTSSQYAINLKKLITKNKNFLAITYNYTGYPMLRELKSMIEKNRLGKIIQINIQMPQESFIRLKEDGTIAKPQNWRLKDSAISTLSLDLGTHLSNMISFLTQEKPIEAIALQNSFGHYDVVDNIMCIIKYSNNIDCHMWYSKSAIGHKNGLKVEISGTEGSISWYQMNPEFLEFNDNVGRNILLDRASKDINIANQTRYNRFKSGHPAGFIEAFANHYYDIHEAIINYKKQKENSKNNYIFDIDDSIESLKLMEAIEKSATSKKWEKINVEN